jgi:hypothetical protein
MYYSTSKEKKTRIADNVEGISMYDYAKTLFFKIADTISIYTTEEGSEKEAAKFDSSVISGLPIFSNTDYKKTFATFYDIDNDEWRLFYTSNGKKFSAVAVCSDIMGFDSSDMMEAFFGSNGADTPEVSDTESETTDTDTDTETEASEE